MKGLVIIFLIGIGYRIYPNGEIHRMDEIIARSLGSGISVMSAMGILATFFSSEEDQI